MLSLLARLWKGASPVRKFLMALVALAGGLGSAVEIHSFFADREITAAVVNKIDRVTREVYERHRDPSPVRNRALADAVTALATNEKVSAADAIELATDVMSRIDLAEESLERGIVMADNSHFEQARREFLSASATDPKSAAAWSNLAAADAGLGRYDEARDAYGRALTLTPEDWHVRYNLGLLFARTGDPAEGLKHVSRAVAVLRSSPDSSTDLNAVLQELKTDPGLEPLRNTPGFAAQVGS
jgi:Flp pilus assembly protein TadD